MNAAIGIPITTNAAEPASTVCLIALLILFFGFWFRVIPYSGVHPPGPARTGQRSKSCDPFHESPEGLSICINSNSMSPSKVSSSVLLKDSTLDSFSENV